VEVVLLLADRQTDGYDEAYGDFRGCANARNTTVVNFLVLVTDVSETFC